MNREEIAAQLAVHEPREVWICFDGDKPGRKAAAGVAECLYVLGVPTTIVHLPDKYDLAECLAKQQNRPGWLAAALFQAQSHEAVA